MIYLIAHLTAAEGKRDQILTAARDVVEGSRKEQACISYSIYQNPFEPDDFVFVERWRDRAAIDAHLNAAHFKNWQKAIQEAVASLKVEILSDAKVESF